MIYFYLIKVLTNEKIGGLKVLPLLFSHWSIPLTVGEGSKASWEGENWWPWASVEPARSAMGWLEKSDHVTTAARCFNSSLKSN
jgi:hypothetical protein